MNLPTQTPDSTNWKKAIQKKPQIFILMIGLIAAVLVAIHLLTSKSIIPTSTKIKKVHLAQKTIDAGDTRWSYYEGGHGPTLLLLHGFVSTKNVWLPVAKELKAHFHLLIPDLPGWGHSSRLAGANYDIEAQAQRVQNFVQELKLKKILIAGHSMGGAIAGVYAATYPAHVNGLMLLDSSGLKARANAFTRSVLDGKDPFIYKNRATFRQAMALIFKHPPHFSNAFVDKLVARSLHDRAFIAHTFKVLNQPAQALSLQHHLAVLHMPVLAIWCRDDQIMDISALKSLRQGLIHAASIHTNILSDCGHDPMLEKPRLTARAITHFAFSH